MLATGDSYDECLTALLDATAAVHGGDHLVLEAGRHPGRLAPPMARRRS
jgi:hypothetical protein